MNEAWRQSDKDAHETKAEALRIALDHLRGVRPIVSVPLDGMIAQLEMGLQHEIDGHEQAAKLVGAS